MRILWLIPSLLFLTACTSFITKSTQVDVSMPSKLPLESQSYTIHQKLTLSNLGAGQPEKQNLWVALIRDFEPYQSVQNRKISPDDYQIVTDEFGNQYAEFDFKDHPAGAKILVDIDYQVTIFEQKYETGFCEGQLPDEFTQPELHIESANPQIVTLSQELSKGQNSICDQIWAFYNFVSDELVYSYNRNDWGAQAALGAMGADCTEYASLMIALSRAANIPARYFEGLLYLEDQNEGVAQTEHAWLDVYLPGSGWAAMDPTIGRMLPNREKYFAHHTTEHIIVTVGRNPSTLRGASYWSHLYWPGDSTEIQIEAADWAIIPLE